MKWKLALYHRDSEGEWRRKWKLVCYIGFGVWGDLVRICISPLSRMIALVMPIVKLIYLLCVPLTFQAGGVVLKESWKPFRNSISPLVKKTQTSSMPHTGHSLIVYQQYAGIFDIGRVAVFVRDR